MYNKHFMSEFMQILEVSVCYTSLQFRVHISNDAWNVICKWKSEIKANSHQWIEKIIGKFLCMSLYRNSQTDTVANLDICGTGLVYHKFCFVVFEDR